MERRFKGERSLRDPWAEKVEWQKTERSFGIMCLKLSPSLSFSLSFSISLSLLLQVCIAVSFVQEKREREDFEKALKIAALKKSLDICAP